MQYRNRLSVPSPGNAPPPVSELGRCPSSSAPIEVPLIGFFLASEEIKSLIAPSTFKRMVVLSSALIGSLCFGASVADALLYQQRL